MTLSAVIERSKTDRESWKYTNLDALAALFPRPVLRSTKCVGEKRDDAKGKADAQLVFLNGTWQPEQSSLDGLPPDILQGDAQTGYTLTLAEQTCLAVSPLELMFLNGPCDEPAEATTNLRIKLGANSRLTLIERHIGQNASAPFAHIMETVIDLREQAKLVHGKIVQGGHVHLADTRVTVAAGAYYDSFTLIAGGKLTRHEIAVTLAGKLAQGRLRGAMLLRGHEHADITSRITHAAPHATSRQLVKAVLDKQSRGVFQGTITVAKGAQKADGYQLSRALLLSDQAEMDAKPELEIYADDVKCSHGSAVGDLDEDMLFYLRSRGLDKTSARALLIEAFINDLIDDLGAPELREAAGRTVREWLNG